MMRELESKEIHIVCLINHLQTQRDTRSANNALMCVCMCAFRWSWQTQTMIAAHCMQSCCFCIAILCLRAFNYSTARRKHIRVQCKQESLHAHVPLNRIAENPVRAYHKAHCTSEKCKYVLSLIGHSSGDGAGRERGGFSERIL